MSNLGDYYGPMPDGGDPPAPNTDSWFWRAAGVVGMLALLAMLAAIGALVAAAIGASDSHTAVHKLNKLLGLWQECDGEVSAAVGVVTKNILWRQETPPGVIPPDTILAVGNNVDNGRIIAAVNNNIAILNKATHTRISTTSFFYANGTVQGGDPYVVWDAINERFFLTAFGVTQCENIMNITSPPSLVGPVCSGTALFGPQSYAVSGPLSTTSPANGCGPIVTPLAGKIAVIVRGVCGFAIKTKNAQDAGAIGVIIYNAVGDIVPLMSGFDPSIVIPAISTGQTIGQAMVANLPVSVSIARNQSTIVYQFNTTMYISVSKTAAPNTASDFWHYAVTGGSYAGTAADFPKQSVDPSALYISTRRFVGFPGGGTTCVGENIRAFNKAALMSGAGAFTLWDNVGLVPNTAPRFLFPAETRTPITDQRLGSVFFGLRSDDEFSACGQNNTRIFIYRATADGAIQPGVGIVNYPTPMRGFVCGPGSTQGNCLVIPTARQPPPAVPLGLDTLPEFLSTGVVLNGRLYLAFAFTVDYASVQIRWFVIDVNPMIENQQPVLMQWGDLSPSSDIDVFIPHIDVTDDGTMGIAFYISGPSQPVVAAYTFRLASDPANTIRMPFHIAVPNNYTYFENAGGQLNRYGDYIGLQVDPVDRQTFYGFTQRPDPLGFFNPPGEPGPCTNLSNCVARDWTTDLFTFRVDTDTCPADGIATTPTHVPIPTESSFVIPDGVSLASIDIGEFGGEGQDGDADFDFDFDDETAECITVEGRLICVK